MKGYCVKDRRSVEIKNPKPVVLNGKTKMHAVSGTCPKCSTRVVRIIKKA